MFENIAKESKVNLAKKDPNVLKNYVKAPANVMPFWVADMDFEVLKPVHKALEKRVDEKIFAYELTDTKLKKSAISWYKKRHNFKMNKNNLRTNGYGVMSSVGILINLLTKKDDEIIIQTPVY